MEVILDRGHRCCPGRGARLAGQTAGSGLCNLVLDALVVKMREEGTVQNLAVYVAIGINMEGHKEVLGLWTSANEGAKLWLSVLTEIKARGVEDIFIACVDGLRGSPQAIEAPSPKTTVQLCIVHMVRAS